jgi:hypothetical protein
VENNTTLVENIWKLKNLFSAGVNGSGVKLPGRACQKALLLLAGAIKMKTTQAHLQ